MSKTLLFCALLFVSSVLIGCNSEPTVTWDPAADAAKSKDKAAGSTPTVPTNGIDN